MNDAQKAFAFDLIMGRIHDRLEQEEGILKNEPTPFCGKTCHHSIAKFKPGECRWPAKA